MNDSKKRLGVYAGSFNPFHLGHADIYLQAKKQFDRVIISVGCNPEKIDVHIDNALPKYSFDIEMVSKYSGFLSDELKRWEHNGENDVTLVRGLRNIYDLNAEQNMLAFVREMYPELKVVYFLSNPKYQHISSSALRDIRKFSEAEYQKYLVK